MEPSDGVLTLQPSDGDGVYGILKSLNHAEATAMSITWELNVTRLRDVQFSEDLPSILHAGSDVWVIVQNLSIDVPGPRMASRMNSIHAK